MEGRRAGLRSAADLYVDETLRRMPEVLRQELEGLAAGSGLPARDLLFAEVMRDGRRFHGVRPGLAGALAWSVVSARRSSSSPVVSPAAAAAPASDFPRIRCGPVGSDAALLAEQGVLVERRPRGGTRTLLLAWPGSLGGVAGASGRGLAVLAVEADLPLAEQRLSEMPFTVRLRRALEESTGAADLVARTSQTTAHRLLVADGPGRTGLLALSALASAPVLDLAGIPAFRLEAEEHAGDVDGAAGRRPDEAAAFAGIPAEPGGAWWELSSEGDGWRLLLGPSGHGGPCESLLPLER